MSKFVDYNKRDVTLPPGCNDLIDVLPSEAPRHSTLLIAALIRRLLPKLFDLWDRLGGASQPLQGSAMGGVTIDRLSGVPHYVAELFKSQSECSTLNIGFSRQQPSIVLLRESQLLTEVAIASRGAESEEGIRQLLQSYGIHLIADCLFPSADAGAEPVRGIWYLLPPVPPSASEITTDLLRRVYGFTDESRIQFQYDEIDA